MLVKKNVFLETDGFLKGMNIGEDVDFCWRIRDSGSDLLYVPFGIVKHKHRNRVVNMFKRRDEYGTSEAVLYDLHRDKRKRFPVPLYAGLSFLVLILTVLILNAYPLISIPILFSIDLIQKSITLKK
jgi:GT2 family glycosyltransferase